MPEPNIAVNNLTFTFPDSTRGLQDISLDLPPGSRTLLIGGKPPLPPPTHPKQQLNPQEQMARAKQPSSASSPANAWPPATP